MEKTGLCPHCKTWHEYEECGHGNPLWNCKAAIEKSMGHDIFVLARDAEKIYEKQLQDVGFVDKKQSPKDLRINVLQNKLALTPGERIELEMLLAQKWGD